MNLTISTRDPADYSRFLAIKSLPAYRFRGHVATFPDEYAGMLDGIAPAVFADPTGGEFEPLPCLFDYQRDIARLAIRKQKFAIFADPGYGKSLMQLEYARHVATQLPANRRILLLAPLMVVEQTVKESDRFYGGSFPLRHLAAPELGDWLLGKGEGRVGIVNFDALNPSLPQGVLGALCVDESSILKSHYGKWGANILRLGAGLRWKLAMTGTPAPNDRVEFANHAVFLDAAPNVNSFLSKYFINRGETANRWEIKHHAIGRFYRDLSHWSIFLSNPATYGWKDNAGGFPPINVRIHDVGLTTQQEQIAYGSSGFLLGCKPAGGFTQRGKMAQLAKGRHDGKDVPTLKLDAVRRLVAEHPGGSSIVWCLHNHEQDSLAAMFPDGANIDSGTTYERRKDLIGDFQAGRRLVLITKPKILGYGMNLQVARQHVFSGLNDSYEDYAQCVKRSNRVGSTEPLDVDIPVTPVERPMLENVLRKAARVAEDAKTQEELFRNALIV